MTKTVALALSLLAWLGSPLQPFAASHPTLVPPPLEIQWSEKIALPPGAVAIVIGQRAAEPERQGARILQEYIFKRFERQWPIVVEGNEGPGHKVRVLVGQRNTSRAVDEMCRKHGIDLSEDSPGHDGYIIQLFRQEDQTAILVGGSNARGTAYGLDTLSQIVLGDRERLTFCGALIRDAPEIRWRGRPQTAVKHYFRPGEMDLYVSARVNFVDLRGGIYAFEPGEKLNRDEITNAVSQAHSRGLVVFGTVNCGVPANRHAQVLGTFKELLALGADGLWLSFDDKGPGDDPIELARKVLELGRAHNISGEKIAVTPPKGSYQQIATDFNRKLMTVPGMETALWFWTSVPTKAALAEARAAGLKRKLGWWHNWPRVFTTHTYTGLPSLALGWHQAGYEALAEGGDCLDAVMPWGGNSFGQHYIAPTICWWGWRPQQHDWNALRNRIFSMVFGAGQESTATLFDDNLQRLFGQFDYASKNSEEVPSCPPRLKALDTKQVTQELIKKLETALDELERSAPEKTLLPLDELKSAYLQPMRKELETHRLAVSLSYPEDWWPEHQRKVLDGIHAGEGQHLADLLAEGRDKVLREMSALENTLPDYPHMNRYLNWWRARAALGVAGWGKLLEDRKIALKERIQEYGRTVVPTRTMLDSLNSPPLEWGIGRWQTSNRLLSTVSPSGKETFWGDWLAGTYEQNGMKVAVFAADRKTPGQPGEYAELTARVPVSGNRTNLALLLYVSAANKDLFSNTFVKYRWAGYRFLEVLWKDNPLWEADLGRVSEKGEWFLVRLPQIPADLHELPLRLRVEDRKLSANNYTICFVGPIRLMEVPE